jgi:hypothetical protein
LTGRQHGKQGWYRNYWLARSRRNAVELPRFGGDDNKLASRACDEDRLASEAKAWKTCCWTRPTPEKPDESFPLAPRKLRKAGNQADG